MVPMSRRITPLADVIAIYRIWRYLRQIQPHIVHAHTPKGGLLGMIAGWLAGVPVRIYHMHGLPLLEATGFRRLLLWLSEWLSCHLAHQVFCVSQSIGEVAVEQALCPREHLEVLGNGSIGGVDACHRFNPALHDAMKTREQYNLPPNAFVIGYVGRVVRDKGIIELTKAWQTLREERDDLHLFIVGPFEPQDPIPRDIEQFLRRDPRVHLVDHWVDDTSILYSAMDLVVLPSYREGFGLVAIEGSAMALPLVATCIPGCVDAVEDSVTGTLVPPKNVAALTDAIRNYTQDEVLRRQHGRAGRERVLRDFRPQMLWQAMYQRYLTLLQENLVPKSTTV